MGRRGEWPRRFAEGLSPAARLDDFDGAKIFEARQSRPPELFLDVPLVHTKATTDSGDLLVEGFANTRELDSFREVVEPSAFLGTMSRYMKFPVLLFQHKFDEPTGLVTSYEIRDDDADPDDKRGLYVYGRLDDAEGTPRRAIQQATKNPPTLKAFSIGFVPKKDEYDHEEGILTILDLELVEISVVGVPANRSSLFSMARSYKQRMGLPENYEEWLVQRAAVRAGAAPIEITSSVEDRKSKEQEGEVRDTLGASEAIPFEATPAPAPSRDPATDPPSPSPEDIEEVASLARSAAEASLSLAAVGAQVIADSLRGK